MPMSLGDMQSFPLTLNQFLDHAAKWHPLAEVVTAGEGGTCARIGYAALRQRSRRVTAVLQGLGISQGDRVATLAWNSQAHLECWYGILGMGAVCHTLNPRLLAEQSAAMVEQAGSRLLIASADLLPLAEAIRALAPSIERLLVIDGADEPRALEPLLACTDESVHWGGFDEGAPSGLCFTSGTTGPPKGVTYTHRSSFLHTLRLLQADGMAISARETVLAVVPMFHANAWGLPFAVPAAGGRLVLPGRHTAGERLAHLIREEHVTLGVGVPTVWLGLAEHIEQTGGELPSLRRIIVGGSPLAAALMDRIEQRLGVTVQTSWGMTELSPLGTVSPPWLEPRRAAQSGRTAVGIDLLLTDRDGEPLARQRGSEGHLKVRGAAVVERYLGQEEAATDAEGWFDTGDLARIDEQGQLFITGRSKDLIKSGGEWINPAEIESLVGALPQVALAAVIGRPDPKWGERPILLVELRDGADPSNEELLAPLAGKVANWWIPDSVIRLPAMPLAATGKIDKLRLCREHGAADLPVP